MNENHDPYDNMLHSEESNPEVGSSVYSQPLAEESVISSAYRYVPQPTAEETETSANPSVPHQPSGVSYNGGAAGPELSKKKKQHKKLTAGKIIALALACSLLGGCLGAGGLFLCQRASDKKAAEKAAEERSANASTILEGTRETQQLETASVKTGEIMTAPEVYAQNVGSTVGITTSVVTTNYWGYQSTYPASGSGFILTADGYILTNYHVIEDASSVTVAAYDGTTYDAAVVGYDENSDVAVLKVDATDLIPVVLGDSSQLYVGDTVLAIGNPLGELTFTLTQGIVSALDREVTLSSNSNTMSLIQTDCAINSGNSGGALFNLYGEVVGITNAKYSSSGSSGEASIDNIGFAIPINQARSIAESIIEKGYISKPYIGVSVATVSEEMQSYGFPKGAAVKEMEEDSPAIQSGLEINDIITMVNDTTIESSADLVKTVGDCKVGDVLNLTVYRQGQTDLMHITLTVGEKQQDALAAQREQQQQQSQQQETMPFSGGDYYGGFPWSFFGF